MADPAPFDPAAAPVFRLTDMWPTLLVDVALPIAVFTLLSRIGVPMFWALVASGLSPAVNNLRTWFRSGRLEPLGLIVLMFLVVGTLASLISGSVFFVLIKESFLTGTFGAICLGSLVARRPLLFFINRQFVAGDDPARLAWWNGLWDVEPFREAMRFVTAVWGVTYLLEALARVGLALLLPPATVVVLSPLLAFGVLIGLIAWNRRYMLAMRERRSRAAAAGQAG